MNKPASPFAAAQTASDVVLTNALHACARRSLPALRQLYDLTAPRLLGELVQLLGDPQAAEAALTECYIDIWQQAGNFSPERCPPGVWLRAIVRHHAIDSLREQQSAAPPDEIDASLRLMDAALAEDTPQQANHILRLAYASARSPAEIARALNWPLQRVQATIRSGLLAMLEAAP